MSAAKEPATFVAIASSPQKARERASNLLVLQAPRARCPIVCRPPIRGYITSRPSRPCLGPTNPLLRPRTAPLCFLLPFRREHVLADQELQDYLSRDDLAFPHQLRTLCLYP